MTSSQRLPFVLVLAAALGSGGCATVKRLLPWGGDGDERADAATTDSSASSTEAKSDASAAGSTDDLGGASNTPASRDAAPAADAAASASASLPRADATLDLSVPAPSLPPSGVSASGAAVAARPTPSTSVASSADVAAEKPGAWAAVLHDAIQRNWLRPSGPQIPIAFSCDVLVKLTRSGIVEDAQVSRSCGHASLDASVLSAVQAASPLPLPADMDEFSDTLLLTFSP